MSVKTTTLMDMPITCSSCGRRVKLRHFRAHLDQHGAERIARERAAQATRGTEAR